jgi:hypothetical protein
MAAIDFQDFQRRVKVTCCSPHPRRSPARARCPARGPPVPGWYMPGTEERSVSATVDSKLRAGVSPVHRIRWKRIRVRRGTHSVPSTLRDAHGASATRPFPAVFAHYCLVAVAACRRGWRVPAPTGPALRLHADAFCAVRLQERLEEARQRHGMTGTNTNGTPPLSGVKQGAGSPAGRSSPAGSPGMPLQPKSPRNPERLQLFSEPR